ncbi:hypothetical protein Kisp02_65120 [Kineosporia sp. NBRC 101731]|nr:hypothetical protein Kisp02_65120 [Kineosporia sp. NBRC 101731]
MKNPKFIVAASRTKKPKITFSRFIDPSGRWHCSEYCSGVLDPSILHPHGSTTLGAPSECPIRAPDRRQRDHSREDGYRHVPGAGRGPLNRQIHRTNWPVGRPRDTAS